MAATITTVDLSQLPAPTVVQQLNFEDIVAAMIADLQARAIADGNEYTALLESDPGYKIIEVCAYREMLLRQDMNEGAQAVMLAYATGSDLDQIGANYDCLRLTITPEDDTTVPPTAAVMETDTAYRARIQLSMERFSCAGPTGAYKSLTLAASSDVLDANVYSPTPGTVAVVVLSRTGNGTAPQATLDAVTAALNAENVRPLCDTVEVVGATINNYSINATLTFFQSVDIDTVMANALAAVQAYVTACHAVGRTVAIAGIIGALMQPGVANVTLNAPGITADQVNDSTHASYCTGITLTSGGYGD
jgi:phage-related baseplate assembly protein